MVQSVASERCKQLSITASDLIRLRRLIGLADLEQKSAVQLASRRAG